MRPRIAATHVAIIALFACSLIQTAQGRVEIAGNIGADTLWTNGDTIQVTSSVLVVSPAQLTIEPGTVILFDWTTGLSISGELTAIGDIGAPIVFNATADTAGGSPAGTWVGLTLNPNSGGTLQHCEIRYAASGISILLANASVHNSVIRDFTNAGVYLDGGSAGPPMLPIIQDCTIKQQDPDLRGTGVGIYARMKTDVTITGCVIRDCRYGLELYSISTGVPNGQVTNCSIINHAAHGIYLHGG